MKTLAAQRGQEVTSTSQVNRRQLNVRKAFSGAKVAQLGRSAKVACVQRSRLVCNAVAAELSAAELRGEIELKSHTNLR